MTVPLSQSSPNPTIMPNEYQRLLPQVLAASKPFLVELKALCEAMDQKYNDIASIYGFECHGCQDNCCLTRFYHHTYLELAYVHDGLSRLDATLRLEISQKAAQVCRKLAAADAHGESLRVMCPLNFSGRCILYANRPMICRLHGIAHEMIPPGQAKILSPGCAAFTNQYQARAYIPFNRTPFYIQMSKLEQTFRQAIGIPAKIKLTVAEMVLQLPEHLSEL